MRINICLSTDKNYIKPLACTIASILKNADIETDLHIFILESDLSDEDKNKILSLKKIKHCEISFIKINAEKFSNIPNFRESLSYISKTAFFRFLIPDLLKDTDKTIYLDSDVIVLRDLKDLFIQDVEQHYIAAVEDMPHYYNSSKYNMLKAFDFYINSGVLLMNLKLWRKEHLSSKLFNIIEENLKDFIYFDQDALNVVCKNKIKSLDFSYNIPTDFLKTGLLLNHPKKQEIIENLKRIKIIHYTTARKPWNYFGYIPLRKYYLYYEKMTPFKTNYTLKTRIKFFIQGFKYPLDKIRIIIDPIINIYREDNFFKLKLFKHFKFNLTKINK